jgi:hypothetical protein
MHQISRRSGRQTTSIVPPQCLVRAWHDAARGHNQHICLTLTPHQYTATVVHILHSPKLLFCFGASQDVQRTMQSKGMVQCGIGNRQLQLMSPDHAQACLKHQGCSRFQMGENCPPVLRCCHWWQMSQLPAVLWKERNNFHQSSQGPKRAKKNVNTERQQAAPVLEGRRYIILYLKKLMAKMDADWHVYWSKKTISTRINQSSSKGNRPYPISKCSVHVLEFVTAHTSCHYHSLTFSTLCVAVQLNKNTGQIGWTGISYKHENYNWRRTSIA